MPSLLLSCTRGFPDSFIDKEAGRRRMLYWSESRQSEAPHYNRAEDGCHRIWSRAACYEKYR